jgi:hypothetical protein
VIPPSVVMKGVPFTTAKTRCGDVAATCKSTTYPPGGAMGVHWFGAAVQIDAVASDASAAETAA